MSRKEKKIMEKITIEEITEQEDNVERAKAKILAQSALGEVYDSIGAGDKEIARKKLDYLKGVLETLVAVGLMDAKDTYQYINEICEDVNEMQ